MPRHPDTLRAVRLTEPRLLAMMAFALSVAVLGAGCPAEYP